MSLKPSKQDKAFVPKTPNCVASKLCLLPSLHYSCR